ncbi:MAG: spermidine/putrescine import ATP-binding protein PotA [Pseudomonadota bacterium]|jgi:ABC-type Fe3+/spermidine/putrescine transport system ATPase subunit
MTALSIQGISKSFGRTVVLRNISLEVDSGDLFFLLGASGCGKSTLLRILAGLEQPDSGSIMIDGTSILDVPAHERGIGMVFQQYALWPHMTVAQNVRFGLEVQGVLRQERNTRVEEALALVRMSDLGSRYPHELSGGQQQRVALARALAVRPRIILLDEPLSNLDARLREEIRHELQELHHSLKVTMIYVTHDQEDALTLATKIALLHSGVVEQVATPIELYHSPQTRYVAEFLGSANILPCQVQAAAHGMVEISLPCAPGERFIANAPGEARPEHSVVCIRPESLSLAKQVSHGAPTIEAIVRNVSFKGPHFDISCETNTGERLLSRAPTTPLAERYLEGDAVFLSWAPGAAVVLGENSRT